jgi:pilus assembly protein Flp/PilA
MHDNSFRCADGPPNEVVRAIPSNRTLDDSNLNRIGEFRLNNCQCLQTTLPQRHFGVEPVGISEDKMNLIKQFVRDKGGATAIEYGLIAALIAVVIIGAVTVVGTSLSTTFTTVSGSLK